MKGWNPGTSARKFADSLDQIIGHPSKVIRVHEIESLPQVNTRDDKFRITPVARSLSVKRDDLLIIIDRALGAEATDDSKSLHLVTTN